MLVFFPTQDMVDFYTKFLEIVLWGQDNTTDGEVEEQQEEEMDLNEDAAELIRTKNLAMDSSGGGTSVQVNSRRKIAGLDTTIKATGINLVFY
jgi:calcineurin-like phosphoesterase